MTLSAYEFCAGEGGGNCQYFWNRDIRLHAHLFGAGPPLIFLHGFPEYWGVWTSQIEEFSRDHLVIVPDLRGFNLSAGPVDIANYTASAVASDVLAIITQLGLPKATIVGHDIGGMVAWWLASQFPLLVERLIIVSSPYPADYLTWRHQPQNKDQSAYVNALISYKTLTWLNPKRLSDWAKNEDFRHRLQAALESSELELVRHYYRANLDEGAYVCWDNLALATCPTLIIYGQQDPFVPPGCFQDAGRRVAAPLTIKEIAGHGHYLHTLASHELNAGLRQWLATNPRK